MKKLVKKEYFAKVAVNSPRLKILSANFCLEKPVALFLCGSFVIQYR